MLREKDDFSHDFRRWSVLCRVYDDRDRDGARRQPTLCMLVSGLASFERNTAKTLAIARQACRSVDGEFRQLSFAVRSNA